MSWANNKPAHFALAVEGVGFSTLCLATLGFLGVGIQVFINTFQQGTSFPGGIIRRGKEKKRRELVIRVTYDGKTTEKTYKLSSLDKVIDVSARLIHQVVNSRITARILGVLRVSNSVSISASVGTPTLKRDNVVAKTTDDVVIKAKLKDTK